MSERDKAIVAAMLKARELCVENDRQRQVIAELVEALEKCFIDMEEVAGITVKPEGKELLSSAKSIIGDNK